MMHGYKARLSDFASLGKCNVLELLKRHSFYILPPNGRKSYEKGFFKVTSCDKMCHRRTCAVAKEKYGAYWSRKRHRRREVFDKNICSTCETT